MASASSMPSLGKRQDLNSLLECSICLETFDDPRTLPCLHSFCKKCLENFVSGKCEDELNCPVCRCKFKLTEGVTGMTRNHFICNMLEVLSIQHQDKCIPCLHCEKPSAGRCVTCELFMCEECFRPHNEYRGFKDHVVLTIQELSKPEHQSKIKGKSYCKKHTSKKLKLYCETCEELICTYCVVFEHVRPDHVCSPLEEIAERKRNDLKINCKKLQRAIADSYSKTQSLKNDHKSLNDNFDGAQRLINEKEEQLLATLHEILQKKTKLLRENARQVFDSKTKKVENKINETETFVNRMKASADMAHSLLENGNDEEIVRSFQSVQENVNNAADTENLESNDENNAVFFLNSNEIYRMLLEEIKDFMKDSDEMREDNEKRQIIETESLDEMIVETKKLVKSDELREDQPSDGAEENQHAQEMPGEVEMIVGSNLDRCDSSKQKAIEYRAELPTYGTEKTRSSSVYTGGKKRGKKSKKSSKEKPMKEYSIFSRYSEKYDPNFSD